MNKPMNAVASARGKVDASSKEVDSGMGKVVDAGATLYWMYVPL